MTAVAEKKSTRTSEQETVEASEAVQFTKPLKVDREKKVIHNVKICGMKSVNGRKYLDKALESAVEARVYEGAAVNLNHPKGKLTDPRDFDDRVAKIFDVRYVPGDGVYGNLRINAPHAAAERIYADAEEGTGFYGLSHNADLKGEYDKDGAFVVNKIVKVRHVDIVADPATTFSLSESRGGSDMKTAEEQAAEQAAVEAEAAKKKAADDALTAKKAKEQADAEAALKGDAKVAALEAKLARMERENTVVAACESAGFKPDAETLADLVGLESAACDRLVKKLAAGVKAGAPKAGVFGGTEQSVVESAGGVKLSELKGESLAAFLLN